MYQNGRCAVDVVSENGSRLCFPNQRSPIDISDRDRRYIASNRRQITRYDSLATAEHRPKRKINKRRPALPEAVRRAHYSVAGKNIKNPGRRNWTSVLGPTTGLLNDEEAFRRVEKCLKQRQNQVPGRILRKLLNRELALGHESLDTIMIATDKVFFDDKLRGRVEWRWSMAGEDGYENELLGTTTPQYSPETGIEARIVLSRPLLESGRYSRDLLLSTFLHELVHCYLFICCGDQAQEDGGHTPGFQLIVRLVNGWIGNSQLRLCSMKADLDNFLVESDDLSHCPTALYDIYRPPPTSQYIDANDCTFVCGSSHHTLLLEDVDSPAEFERIHENVFLPPLAYVSMQERMMQAFGGSASMPILVE